ncbi:MAG: hypothetical protein PHG35_01805 [Dehalococcoidales bacterium]|nr:hypothetical protein [Dehalococcoidales bacterium]
MTTGVARHLVGETGYGFTSGSWGKGILYPSQLLGNKGFDIKPCSSIT